MAADKYYTFYRRDWSSAYDLSLPLEAIACKQRTDGESIIKANIYHFFVKACLQNKSRLLAITSSHCRDWSYSLSIVLYGICLVNEDMRVAVSQHLGSVFCHAHQGSCETLIEANGLHGLLFKLSSGKQIQDML